ncbi:MAG: hypothetical protein ABW220_10250 [Burkholderiaceae bacterium]
MSHLSLWMLWGALLVLLLLTTLRLDWLKVWWVDHVRRLPRGEAGQLDREIESGEPAADRKKAPLRPGRPAAVPVHALQGHAALVLHRPGSHRTPKRH